MLCGENYKINFVSNICLVIYSLLYIYYYNFKSEVCVNALAYVTLAFIIIEIFLEVGSNIANSSKSSLGAEHSDYKKKPSSNFESNPIVEVFSRPKTKLKHKLSYLGFVIASSTISILLTHLVVVLFGAYAIQQRTETFIFSFLIATLVIIRPLIRFGLPAILVVCEDWAWSNSAQVQGLFVLIGAWLGTFFIPLDWDRPWQVWPLPCAIGGLVGELISSLVLLITGSKRPKKIA